MEQDPKLILKHINKHVEKIQELAEKLYDSLQAQIERNQSLQSQLDTAVTGGTFDSPYPFSGIVPSNTEDSSYASFYNPFSAAGKVVAQIKVIDTSKDKKFTETLETTINILTAKVTNADLLLQNAEKALNSAEVLKTTESYKNVKVSKLVNSLIRNITNYRDAAKKFMNK